jgi:hypothetical protein
MSKPKVQEEVVLACDLSALTDAQRQQHGADAEKLFSKISEARELSDGYALHLANEDGMLSLIADFIRDESLCCPFINFGVEVEAFKMGIWLKLSGSEEVKQFIAAEIGGILTENIATVSGD